MYRSLVASILLLFLAAPARAQEASWTDLEGQFRDLPMEARRLTGPLFWLHGDESPEQLVGELERVAEGGNGNFTAESRPHADWLGPGWYRDLQVCLDAAKRLNLHMWIFDERWWPSGEVGGKVPREFGTERLAITGFYKVGGPFEVETDLFVPPGTRLVAVLAGHETGTDQIDASSIIDLTDHVKDGKLVWKSTAANWRILPIVAVPSVGRGDRILVNGASQAAVDWYLDTVYKPHHDHFGADFGQTIQGYFYDEPETPGDFGTEVIPELTRRGVDWRKALVAHTLGLSDPEEDAAYKIAYREALAEAWGRTLYGGITEWCHDHNVRSIGHFLEHAREYLHDDECAGDMVQLQKYSDMGAIDAVFTQFIPGRKDSDTYQTPKLGSSISHAYGKADDLAMVEIFGARGQDLSYSEMKWWTDLMHVAGINFHIPHSFNPRAPYDVDCPPFFYHGGYEPRWPLYRVYADYTSRLSLLLTGGRHVAPVALLYAGQGYHFPPATTPEDLTTALQDALFDCDWIPYDAFDAATIDGSRLALHQERYRIVIVPAVTYIPPGTLEKVRDFYEAGGIVVAYGRLATLSATPERPSAEVQALTVAIWGENPTPGLAACNTNAANGRAYFLPETPTPEQVQAALTGDAGVHPTLEVISGDTGHWLHVLHRQKAGRDVFLVCNQEYQGPTRPFRFRLQASGTPEIWDAMRNERMSVPFDRQGETVELELTLEPLESLLIVFRPDTDPPASPPLPARDSKAVRTIPVSVQQIEEGPSSRPSEAPNTPTTKLAGLSWVWAPDVPDPSVAAPVGILSFRKVIELPAEGMPTRALAVLAADNYCTLYVNGENRSVGALGAGDWQSPAIIDLTQVLKPGPNVLVVNVANVSDRPNPAGLLGTVVLTDPTGAETLVPVDATWRVSVPQRAEAYRPGFDDSAWPLAREFARVGQGPWGDPSRPPLTLSPIDRARTFVGTAELPGDFEPASTRVDLVLDSLEPEAAARVTINGHDAVGFIGKPLRLDVSRWLVPGNNEIRITPFAPSNAWLVVRE